MDRRERLDDPIEAQRAAMDGKQAEMWTALPGIVTGYNPGAMTVSVQPAVNGSVTDESGNAASVSLPQLVDVPVCFPTGGGFTLTFPVKSGDECIVVFSSRCIDGWWQSGGGQPPAEPRMHDLSDGMAIMGLRSQSRPLTPPADSENIQLRSDDGEQHVTITPEGDMTHQATKSLTLASPQIILKGAVSMMGFNGGKTKATLEGTLQATDDVLSGNISGKSHTHPGDSGGTTGAPR